MADVVYNLTVYSAQRDLLETVPYQLEAPALRAFGLKRAKLASGQMVVLWRVHSNGQQERVAQQIARATKPQRRREWNRANSAYHAG